MSVLLSDDGRGGRTGFPLLSVGGGSLFPLLSVGGGGLFGELPSLEGSLGFWSSDEGSSGWTSELGLSSPCVPSSAIKSSGIGIAATMATKVTKKTKKNFIFEVSLNYY